MVLRGGYYTPGAGTKAIEMSKNDRLCNLCGFTEGGPVEVRLRPEDQVREAGAGGFPAVDCESRGVNEAEEDVAVSKVGEWLVRCESNMLHYYRNPKATAETLTPEGGVRSGELASVDQEGSVTTVNRKKNMITSVER